MSNPFDSMAQALWDLLEADGSWSALVLPANRIKGLFDKPGGHGSDADYPRVRLVAGPMQALESISDRRLSFDQIYELHVKTNDRTWGDLNAVKWASLAVLGPLALMDRPLSAVPAVRSLAVGLARPGAGMGEGGGRPGWQMVLEMRLTVDAAVGSEGTLVV